MDARFVIHFSDQQIAAIVAAVQPVGYRDRAQFLSDVVRALGGANEVGNAELRRVLIETQLLYRGGPAGDDGT
jgi:hypothetical protein